MKFRSEQSARTWLEFSELLSTILIGINAGALFSHWFDSTTVGLVAMGLSFPFFFIAIKARVKVQDARFNEQLDALRYRGLYPPEGEGSDDDVKRLRDMGYKAQAFRLYRELHGAPLAIARGAVDAL